MKPVIPWMGGKRRLASHIIPLLINHECYTEVFAGAAAIFFAKEPSKVEVLNDINGELINLYRVIQNHLEEFVRQFKWALYSRQIFEWEKLKQPATLTDIQRAARFYYLQRTAFGGKVSGQTFGTAPSTKPKFNLVNMEYELTEAYQRLTRVYIEQLDWLKCIDKYDREKTLFYCDPPYYETAGYGVDFDRAQYEMLADRARRIKGKMIISINDHKEIRKIFTGLKLKKVSINYTVGKKNNEKSHELIIKNW